MALLTATLALTGLATTTASAAADAAAAGVAPWAASGGVWPELRSGRTSKHKNPTARILLFISFTPRLPPGGVAAAKSATARQVAAPPEHKCQPDSRRNDPPASP